MAHARLSVTRADIVAPVSPRLFGSFVEHMGRARLHRHLRARPPHRRRATASAATCSTLVKELGSTVIRYPGGNFVSGYRWEDGVGPRRAARRASTWPGTAVETNEVGLHEFADWADEAGVEVMQAVNLGTRGIEEAARLLEYTNHPGRHRAAPTSAAPTAATEPVRHHGCGAWATRWTARGRSATRPPTSTAGSPPRPRRRHEAGSTRRIELVAAGSSNAEHAHLRRVGATVLEHDLRPGRLHLAARLLRGDATATSAASWPPAVGHGPLHRRRRRHHRRRRARRAAREAPSASPSTSGTSGTRPGSTRSTRTPSPTSGTPHPRLIEDEYTVTDAVVGRAPC